MNLSHELLCEWEHFGSATERMLNFLGSGNLTGRGLEDEKTKNATVVFFVVVVSKKKLQLLGNHYRVVFINVSKLGCPHL